MLDTERGGACESDAVCTQCAPGLYYDVLSVYHVAVDKSSIFSVHGSIRLVAHGSTRVWIDLSA